ncbi:ankyrin 2,3/unc44 [Thraustotheca clavata]|uniref:Ankyrin 2,3/unc44 n=1 Tax=Thraustotheca clavata TaxID=74557 RepID=A0A1V9YTK1_9STRA|nr:ankyrin 2,3/unc44 [Thraustotheca clavata]
MTPLYAACFYGHDMLIPYLITQNNANTGTYDIEDFPLYIAGSKGFSKVVNALLDNEYVQVDFACKNGNTTMHEAVKRGHKSIVSILLANEAFSDKLNEDKETALLLSARFGYKCIAKLLLKYEANINFKNNDGDTPLHIAAINNRVDMVKMFLEGNANSNIVNKNNQTALDIAISKKHDDIANILQQNFDEKQLLAAVKNGNEEKEPLLHTCIHQGNIKVLSVLLESPSIDLNCIDKNGHTPLEKALFYALNSNSPVTHSPTKHVKPSFTNNKAFAIAVKLLCGKSNHTLMHEALFIEELSDCNTYDLLHAVNSNNIVLIQQLLVQGADPNISNEMGSYLVHNAASNGFAELLQILLRNNAKVDVVDANGCSPLHVATANGHEIIVQLLLDSGANGNHTNKMGNTPLHIAAASGFDTIATLLLNNSFIYHSPLNEEGMTPLQLAAQAGMDKIVDLISECGVDVNHQNKDGQTTLHFAAKQGSFEIVKKLLALNAQIDIRSWNGDTPLHFATMSGNENIVQLLLDAGADMDQPNQNAFIPEMLGSSLIIRQIFQDKRKYRQQKTKIISAILEGSIHCVKTLLAEGGDCNTIDESGNSLLHLSIETNQIEMVRLLLNQPNIDKHKMNTNKDTPILFAIKLGYREIARCLYDATQVDIIHAQGDDIFFDERILLGVGCYGSVYKGTVHDKIIAVKKSNRNNMTELLIEIDAMKKYFKSCKTFHLQMITRCPYIVELIAVDENKKNPSLALEYMDCGNLRQHLDAKRTGIETKINVTPLQVAWVLANALAELHSKKMMHRDLKSLNVLLSTEHYIKLGDFGASREVDSSMTTKTGTPLWTAPEVFESGSHYSFPADIYSFGVILTELDTLQHPYANIKLHPFSILEQVRQGNLRPSVSSTCEPWLKALSAQCLAFDPNQRPSAEQIVGILQKLHRQNFEPDIPNDILMTRNSNATSFMSNTISTVSSSLLLTSSKILSTTIVCKACRTSNSFTLESCQKCSILMPSVSEKLQVLLKRVKVAKKKNIEIEATIGCDICGFENPIDEQICKDEDCLSELIPLTDEEKMFRLIKAFERAA